MKAWQIAIAALALLAPAGCRTDPAIPILERELRCREDEIYRLRATIEDLQDEVRASGQRGSPRAPSDSTNFAPRYKSGTEPRSDAPETEAPSVEMPSQPSGRVPDVLKRPAGSPGEAPKPLPHSGRGTDSPGGATDGPLLEQDGQSSLPPGETASRVQQASLSVPINPSGNSRQVASIVINGELTGGISAAGGPDDDGLLVVVEPRDRHGRPVAAPADVSVAVFDPAVRDEEGLAVLVGRWDFTTAETGSLFRRTGQAGAVHLTMAWPEGPPKHHKLHVFVRYITDDGRKLQTDGPIDVAPTEPPTRWASKATSTDRPADRDDSSQSPPDDRAKPHRPVWSPERQ